VFTLKLHQRGIRQLQDPDTGTSIQAIDEYAVRVRCGANVFAVALFPTWDSAATWGAASSCSYTVRKAGKRQCLLGVEVQSVPRTLHVLTQDANASQP
jgi:hypothetical protein